MFILSTMLHRLVYAAGWMLVLLNGLGCLTMSSWAVRGLGGVLVVAGVVGIARSLRSRVVLHPDRMVVHRVFVPRREVPIGEVRRFSDQFVRDVGRWLVIELVDGERLRACAIHVGPPQVQRWNELLEAVQKAHHHAVR